MLDKAVKYAQEARLRSRRRQQPAAGTSSIPVAKPVAPQSTTSGIQTASLSQVSGDTTRNLTMLPLLLNRAPGAPSMRALAFRRLLQAAQLVCADLGGEVKAPPDASIADCIRELGEAVGYTPAKGVSLKQQLAAIIQLTGTSVPGW